jgi:hypothetical protein
MSSKGRLGLNLFEKNLKRHPSVKGLFDENGNKKSPSNSKNEFLILNADNKSDDSTKNQSNDLDEKLKEFEKDEEKENEDAKEMLKSNPISVQINRVEEKEVDNSNSYFTELDNEEKKQIINNNKKYKTNKNNLSVPLSYEFNDEQKKIDQQIIEAMSKGKNLDQIEEKLKLKDKK